MSRNWLSDYQLRKKLGDCGRTSLHRYREQDPRFPRPRRYGGRNLTPEDEVDAYLDAYFVDPAPRPGTRPGEQPRDRRGCFADEAKRVRRGAGGGSGP